MQQIAVVKPDGQIKPTGKSTLSDEQITLMERWYQDQKERRDQRAANRLEDLIDELNAVTQWLQSDADSALVKSQTEPLLMALHDFRMTLARCLSKDS